MLRANSVDLRKACEVVEALKKAGILFVPVPVLDKDDHIQLIGNMQRRLTIMEGDAVQLENKKD